MERKKRAQFGTALFVWMLVGAIFILPASAEKTGDNWIDSFDQWVEPRDMSMYTKDIVIEEPNCTISQEEVKRTPGLMVIDKDADMSLCKHEMKIDYLPNYTADLTVTDASAGGIDATEEDYSVAMTNGTATWYRIHATYGGGILQSHKIGLPARPRCVVQTLTGSHTAWRQEIFSRL